ncbi:hypothetical protein [Candidatus Thalassolituus haligoni]|uniref:hypothetical protein n=1 Tax=Candidatus Thalassolituus haligoni TaxID=3100113 RepID=UPI003512BD7E|tara:strand:+ start:2712 stop:3002 length:291 start_codon:yes stop_codon:yes gene_type:complete
MQLDKAKKRIAKKVKRGFQGYPLIAITYFGSTTDQADEVSVTLTLEEGAEALEERFKSTDDARENATIQSALVKIIERTDCKTLQENPDVTLVPAP